MDGTKQLEAAKDLRYTRRPDGKIAITLDNNVWNFLFDRQKDLAGEFPREHFAIFIPREVEIEWRAIPEERAAALKRYIEATIAACDIRTTANFGFYNPDLVDQRSAPMGFGTFQSPVEGAFYDLIRERFLEGREQRKNGLYGYEGDAAVAVQSFFSVVLTLERPQSRGPLKVATEHGGKVLSLHSFDSQALTLREWVIRFEREPQTPHTV
jgi:hypothetical protein